MSTLRLKFVPIVVCLALGLAACGDDSSTTTTDAATDDATTPIDNGDGGGYNYGDPVTETDPDDTSATSATDASDTTVDDSGGEDDVMLADTSIGVVLVDPAGMTLYLFANDPPDTVTCTADCAVTWPPLLADDDSIHVGDGLDEGQFTIVDGGNGPQVSYWGHPLYYYAGDSAPGDVNGNGVGNVWFAIGADGDPVT